MVERSLPSEKAGAFIHTELELEEYQQFVLSL
jgi:hypothetical protein